jgi:2-polyprenyl-3-methyl-5-hydroxy-6-metoxy-1,4-benzoquinol methylase
MTKQYHYPGRELELFEEAKNWKRYFATHIKKYIQGDVIEVGAGIGETTAFLVNEKVNSWICLEPDRTLFDTIQQKIERKVLPGYCQAIRGTLDNIEPNKKFDTIIYIDVLEHIENDHAEIIQACNHLKNNGHLIILSPAFQFLYTPFDRAIGHFRRYTKKTLSAVVSCSNLVKQKMLYLESAGALLLIINKLLLKKNNPSRAVVKIWDAVFVPLSRISDKLSFHFIGKTIIGVWRYKI